MPFLDDRATTELRTLMAALSTGPDAPEYAAALALVHAWVGGELDETDDAGSTRLLSPSHGIGLRLNGGRLASIAFELTANPEFEAFAHPAQLLSGLDPSASKSEVRTTLGQPIESAYDNDWYLLDGVDAAVYLGWRSTGVLQRLVLVNRDGKELARLRRKAAKVVEQAAAQAAGRPVRVEVPEEDGILGIVDPDAYRASLPDWDFASLTRHLESESAAGRGVFWMAGPPEFATYGIEVRTTASDRPSERESEHVVRASKGRLRLVGYGTLTMAADSATERLDDDPDADVAVPAGRLLLRIRQLTATADDDAEIPFEIVVQKLGKRRAKATAQLAWWTKR
ncbi:hypothetical protein [Kribbella shirazensis]|uniref:Uncharacterized protein n=1 Tax=Kribbella shirazensis TaxID=1105143 RepID=A0A7X5V9M3_9ACTN|nr:hypothetical protein [Kribbella shirazensis]NIK57118.1 hypothetical protein [Kribbella shirazensis]